jgi:NDP-sugar pyrophosphorylase family protein
VIGAVFAGGFGKRLQSEYPDIPKVLLPLKGNYLILDRQLEEFRNAGITEVYLLTGYRGEMIEERYHEQWKGVRINYLREREPMGTLWALRNLFSNIDSDVLLRNGDTICDVDLQKFMEKSTSNRKLVNILVVRMRSPFGVVSLRRNSVIDINEKPLLPHYINGGIYFLRKEVKVFLNRKYSERNIENSLFRNLAVKKEIQAFKYNGFWKPVDSVKDYDEIREIYRNRKV